MVFRKLAFAVVVSSLVAVAAGCGADSTPDSPSETGTAKGKGAGKTRDDSPTEPGDGDGRGPGRPDDDGPSGPSDGPSDGDDPKTSTNKKNGAQCAESADCESDFCVFQGSGLGMCTTTCDGDIDCDLSWRCVKLSNAPQKVCAPE